MVYGYVRVSTPKQSLERQIRKIKSDCADVVIVKDVFTGTTAARPGWERLIKRVRKGDTIIFDEVSRMSRNAEEGYAIYMELYERGVELRFLREPYIDTSVFRSALEVKLPEVGAPVDLILKGIGEYLRAVAREQIRIAFEQSEGEVERLRQRTREGIETARLAGKQIGGQKGRKLHVRKAAEAKAVIQKYSRDFGGTLQDKEVIKLAGVSRNTYYHYKRELKGG